MMIAFINVPSKCRTHIHSRLVLKYSRLIILDIGLPDFFTVAYSHQGRFLRRGQGDSVSLKKKKKKNESSMHSFCSSCFKYRINDCLQSEKLLQTIHLVSEL